MSLDLCVRRGPGSVPIGPADPLGPSAATLPSPMRRSSWHPGEKEWSAMAHSGPLSDQLGRAHGTIKLDSCHLPVRSLTVSQMDSGIPAIATPDIAA